MEKRFNLKSYKPDKLYGTTTLGARGQVVIPAEARKELKLKPGDHLMVSSKFGKVLSMFKADQMSELVEMIMKSVAGTPYEKEISRRIKELLGNYKKVF